MTWWQVAVLVVGGIVTVAFGIVWGLMARWRWQERRDGIR